MTKHHHSRKLMTAVNLGGILSQTHWLRPVGAPLCTKTRWANGKWMGMRLHSNWCEVDFMQGLQGGARVPSCVCLLRVILLLHYGLTWTAGDVPDWEWDCNSSHWRWYYDIKGVGESRPPFFYSNFLWRPDTFFYFFLYSLKKDYYFAGLLERVIFPRQISKSILYRER